MFIHLQNVLFSIYLFGVLVKSVARSQAECQLIQNDISYHKITSPTTTFLQLIVCNGLIFD